MCSLEGKEWARNSWASVKQKSWVDCSPEPRGSSLISSVVYQTRRRRRGRSLKLTICRLENMSQSIPKGKARKMLKDCGRIVDTQAARSMSPAVVKEVINRAFHRFGNSWCYLETGQDNMLVEASPDGQSICGAAYIFWTRWVLLDTCSKQLCMVTSLFETQHISPENQPTPETPEIQPTPVNQPTPVTQHTPASQLFSGSQPPPAYHWENWGRKCWGNPEFLSMYNNSHVQWNVLYPICWFCQ